MASTISIFTLAHGTRIFASWRIRSRSSTQWVELDGTVKTRKIWDGKANLEEIEAGNGAMHFKGLTLFLSNPQTRQWSQNFASINDGAMSTTPLMGEFKDGQGEL